MTIEKQISQEEKVLHHLRQFGSITPKQAWLEHGIQRLSARIRRLREDGHEITTEQDGPHDYATYRLVNDEK